MSDTATLGLAGLLAAMAPRPPEPDVPPPDPEAIRADAWNQGFEAGAASAEAGLAPLRLHLAEASAALTAACTIDVDGLRPLVIDLVRQVAEAVIEGELRSDPALLRRLVEAALVLVAPAEMPKLKAHPATLAHLRPHLPDIAVIADVGLAEDAFEVVGTDFVIAAGLDARLADIIGELA